MHAHSQASGYPDAARNVMQLALWVFAWVATLALASFGPTHLWDSHTGASWIAILGNIAVGVGLIVVHARYLTTLDELQRKIMMDAMAVTLGAGLVGGCAYGAAANIDLISRDANIGYLILLMGVVYVVATIAGNIRYR